MNYFTEEDIERIIKSLKPLATLDEIQEELFKLKLANFIKSGEPSKPIQ